MAIACRERGGGRGKETLRKGEREREREREEKKRERESERKLKERLIDNVITIIIRMIHLYEVRYQQPTNNKTRSIFRGYCGFSD
jgi:hypothetical protein